MKCPQCESPCEPEHEADPSANTDIGRLHYLACGWSEPEDDPAPKWCLARIEHLENVVDAMRPVVQAAVSYGMSPSGCHRSEARLVEAAGLFAANTAIGTKT